MHNLNGNRCEVTVYHKMYHLVTAVARHLTIKTGQPALQREIAGPNAQLPLNAAMAVTAPRVTEASTAT